MVLKSLHLWLTSFLYAQEIHARDSNKEGQQLWEARFPLQVGTWDTNKFHKGLRKVPLSLITPLGHIAKQADLVLKTEF